jgi:acetyltransferase-like isoleucine patch superfamily enzyme
MTSLRQATQFAGKLFPFAGWLANRMAFPSLHCGVAVELPSPSFMHVGDHVRIGAYSRLYCMRTGSIHLGDNVGLGRDVHLQTESGILSVGANTGLNDHSRLYGTVSIGRNCLIAPNFYASSGHHQFRSQEPYLLISDQEDKASPQEAAVSIGDDCWIGINVVVLHGVSIGRGAVIGANTVVRKDVAPYSIVAGNPGKVIGKRFDFQPPRSIDAREPRDLPYFYAGFAQRRGDPLCDSGMACDRTFTVAMSAPEQKDWVLELEIDTDANVSLSHGLAEVSGGPGRFYAHFNIPFEEFPYLTFTSDTACKLLTAKLLPP